MQSSPVTDVCWCCRCCLSPDGVGWVGGERAEGTAQSIRGCNRFWASPSPLRTEVWRSTGKYQTSWMQWARGESPLVTESLKSPVWKGPWKIIRSCLLWERESRWAYLAPSPTTSWKHPVTGVLPHPCGGCSCWSHYRKFLISRQDLFQCNLCSLPLVFSMWVLVKGELLSSL